MNAVIDSVAREVFYRKLGSFPTELDNINSTNSMIKELRCKLLRNSDALTSENYKVLLCDELTIRPMDSDELASSLKLPFSKLSVLLSELEVGDTVLTTSGFYGVIIDITDDDVIVEFGSNKNCRIPMQKSAIVQVEKPDAE